MGQVFDYVGCFFLRHCEVWMELSLCDGLGNIHDCLKFHAISGRATAKPSCDASRKCDFSGASILIQEWVGREAVS